MTEHGVKDLSLAPAGKLKIDWTEQSMPVLRQVRERFGEAWERYAARTPRFIPRDLRRSPASRRSLTSDSHAASEGGPQKQPGPSSGAKRLGKPRPSN